MRIDSSCENDVLSQRKLPMMGIVKGPGGILLEREGMRIVLRIRMKKRGRKKKKKKKKHKETSIVLEEV